MLHERSAMDRYVHHVIQILLMTATYHIERSMPPLAFVRQEACILRAVRRNQAPAKNHFFFPNHTTEVDRVGRGTTSSSGNKMRAGNPEDHLRSYQAAS